MKKLFLIIGLTAITSISYGQQFYSDKNIDPIDGRHVYVSNGDIQFHQFSTTLDSIVCFGINNSYFCSDGMLDVEFAIFVRGEWVKHSIQLYPYNASEWAYQDFLISSNFIQDLIKGSKYIYKYTDAHCSIERGEGSLNGITANFNKVGIPLN
jgi:hypothetical protein